eukprot:COSAG02_NODE_43838_length_371_cov_0.834559_1_plen_56_part_10
MSDPGGGPSAQVVSSVIELSSLRYRGPPKNGVAWRPEPPNPYATPPGPRLLPRRDS